MEVFGSREAIKSFIFISNVSDIITSCNISKGFRYRQRLFLYSTLLTEVSLPHEVLLLHFPNLPALSCFHLKQRPFCMVVSASSSFNLKMMQKCFAIRISMWSTILHIWVTMLDQVRGHLPNSLGTLLAVYQDPYHGKRAEECQKNLI